MKNTATYIIASCLMAAALGFSVAATNAQTVISSGPIQPCTTFSYNLGRGASGQDVSLLQSLLIQENLLHIAQPTGYFGGLTFSATVAFQSEYGILQTGFAGPLTRAKLNSLYGCGVPVNPVTVGPGQHCGGNIANAPICQSGYYCAPTPGSPLPFGDVGGICEPTTINNQSPVISGVSGPTALNVGQTGTWSINASDPENGTLSYSVVWGDQVFYPLPAINSANGITYNQTATFTHAYSSAGTYAPVFYVRDANGNTATASLSVNVGNTYTNLPIINYLQPTSGPTGTTVTMVGSGFMPTGNRIAFGNSGIENDPAYNLSSSNNGSTITFTVPYTDYVACLNSVPACMIAEQLITPGSYPVSVITSSGTSNQVSFTVTSQSCTPNWQCTWTPCNNGYQGMTATDINHCGIVSNQGPGIACPALARQCN